MANWCAWGFQVIILDEQPGRGRTIIEKIEAHSDVGYAVVLLTPDDHGGLAGADSQPRARQNVVFELGYFIGKLTRARVSAIRRGDMEGLSDFGGVEYIPWDAVKGTWRNKLGQELQAAGFPGLKLDAVLA